MEYPLTPAEHITIKDLPTDEQPREKLLRHGPGALTDAELLAIILRTGKEGLNVLDASRKLLRDTGGLLYMARKSHAELRQQSAVGKVKALTLQAVFELGRRIQQADIQDRLNFKDDDAVANYMKPLLRDLNVEHFYALFLDIRLSLIQCKKMSEGGKTGTLVDVQLIAKEAVLCDANAVILVHNHPSGNPMPSNSDRDLTERVETALKYFGIKVTDHIIIAGNGHYSMRVHGLMKESA